MVILYKKRIEEIKQDIDKIFTEVLKIASEIDNKLGNFIDDKSSIMINF